MQNKKSAHPDTAMSERAVEMGPASQARPPLHHKNTTVPIPGQRISDLLSHGAENGVTLSDLAALTGLDGRVIRLAIRRERLSGVPICEDSQNGYYLPSSTTERDICAKRLRHRAAQIVKVADAIAKAAIEKGKDGIA